MREEKRTLRVNMNKIGDVYLRDILFCLNLVKTYEIFIPTRFVIETSRKLDEFLQLSPAKLKYL